MYKANYRIQKCFYSRLENVDWAIKLWNTKIPIIEIHKCSYAVCVSKSNLGSATSEPCKNIGGSKSKVWKKYTQQKNQ